MNKYLKTKEGSLEDLAKQMQNKVLESDYQDKFKKELDKAGKPIGQMTGAEKKAFFNKIDKMHTAKNEQAKNPYAIGMAAAMKAKNDQPPLKKSTITKAHDIAKSIEKDQKEEVSQKEIDKFHTSLDKLVHKSFGHSSDEKKKEMKNETHSFVTNKQNEKQKKADGEKQVVDPEPKLKESKAKMSFKEAYKKVKEAMNTVGDATADRANQMVGQDDKKKDPDIKKPKATTDAGTKATPIDTSPEIEYKN